jgi:hypothetical protein
MSLTPCYQDIFGSGIESDISCATEPVWPDWSDLVIAPKNLKLTEQPTELQAVIHQTMAIVEEWFIFENLYPVLIEHNSWKRHAVAQACEEMGGSAPDCAKIKYQTIAECMEADHGYLKEISSLVSHYSMGTIPIPMLILEFHTQLDPRISLNQGIVRNAGTSNIKSYGIFIGNTVNRQLVNDLLFKYNYIYAPHVHITAIAPTIAQ